MPRGCLILLFLLSAFTATADMRVWTPAEGRAFAGELIALQKGRAVFRLEDGQMIGVPIQDLAPADQQEILRRVQAQEARKAQPKATPPAPSRASSQRPWPRSPAPTASPPGKVAPEIRGARPGEQSGTTLSSLRGQLVLVEFWSPTHPLYQTELPVVQQLVAKYGDRGFAVFGVCKDKMPVRRIHAYARQKKITWPIAFDRTEEIAQLWGVEKLPARVLVDQNGVIVANSFSLPELEALIRRYLRLDP